MRIHDHTHLYSHHRPTPLLNTESQHNLELLQIGVQLYAMGLWVAWVLRVVLEPCRQLTILNSEWSKGGGGEKKLQWNPFAWVNVKVFTSRVHFPLSSSISLLAFAFRLAIIA